MNDTVEYTFSFGQLPIRWEGFEARPTREQVGELARLRKYSLLSHE